MTMTSDVDPLYIEMLKVGFIVLRRALESKDEEWLQAEVEMLHNVPSLINEPNTYRHEYFWTQEREHYISRINGVEAGEARYCMATYYEPIWGKLERLVSQLKRPYD